VRVALPFGKTAVNILESGIERTPGVGMLPSVQKWAQTPADLLRRRQALGALAMAGGVGVGAATAEGGPLEDYRWAQPFAEAATATYALPFAVASRASRPLFEGGDWGDVAGGVVSGVREQAPLPRNMNPQGMAADLLRQYLLPYGGLLDLMSTVDPSQLGGSRSLFAGTLSDVPVLNELLAESVARRGRGGTRATGIPPGVDPWVD
jgi:hypothetical protein